MRTVLFPEDKTSTGECRCPYLTSLAINVLIIVDDLAVPELLTEENDEVDIEAFWRQVELSIVARGLIRGKHLT